MFFFVSYALAMLCLKHELILAVDVRKFVYQKDVSEHCRRRVMPSVFLGRHVVNANSQILHFTRLELPYSCFISVRSESGTNLILVIKMVTEDIITSSCSKNGNQLLVYEMSETFGGYWGPLSDSIIKRDSINDSKFYTLKTTQSTEHSTTKPDEYDDTVTTTSESVDTKITKSDDDAEYIRVEVPIVNVSSKLIPGELPRKTVYDIDDTFDFLYDVTPRRDISYDTSIIPLVQFSLKKVTDVHRKSGQEEPNYKVNNNLKTITPDGRLLFSTRLVKGKPFKKHKYNANNRLDFKTKKFHFATYRRHSYLKKPLTITQQHALANLTIFGGPTTENISLLNKKLRENISWDFVDDLMKSFGKTASNTRAEGTSQDFKNISMFFQKISDSRHISSVYLSPNLSIYYKDVPLHASVPRMSTTSTENSFGIIKGTDKKMLSIKSTLSKAPSTHVTNAFHVVSNRIITSNTSSMQNSSYIGDQEENAKVSATTVPMTINGKSTASSLVSKSKENLTGSLVNRESWDNVVQVAPVMAGILYHLKANQSHSSQDLNVTKRKKRYIESVPVANARPHNITMKGDAVSTAAAKYDIGDMQDFAQLVEIQDDELHGRVALRYLRRYVGPALLNICDYTDVASRHVYLFNSSRIVLAISNFTMNSMTVIATPARTVVGGDGRCPDDHLECQVSGARVCIDSMTACDGIPNCGSNDIYDEDRLMCGAAIGLQHNVYLAAFTFLAVLLTVLYGVHYWLKRCVPKVSDAFFLYTDGTENVLYLDTIMRSPAEDTSKIAYPGNILDDDLLLFSGVNEEKKPNKFKRFCKSFFTCNLFRKKHKKKDAYNKMAQEGLYASLEEKKERYSYAELELRKILEAEQVKRDIAVQTGDSLEMSPLISLGSNCIRTKNQRQMPQKSNIASDSLLVSNEEISLQEMNKLRSLDELSILNFFNHSKDSSTSKSSDDRVAKSSITYEEKEIKNLTYDQKLHIENIVKTTSSILAKANVHGKVRSDRNEKHLRFNEETTTIPPADHDNDSDEDANESLNRRRSVVLGVGRSWRRDFDSIEEDDENAGNVYGNSIRFWGKSRKTKK